MVQVAGCQEGCLPPPLPLADLITKAAPCTHPLALITTSTFLIFSFSCMSHSCLKMTHCDYPDILCLMLVSKLGTFSKDQNSTSKNQPERKPLEQSRPGVRTDTATKFMGRLQHSRGKGFCLIVIYLFHISIHFPHPRLSCQDSESRITWES